LEVDVAVAPSVEIELDRDVRIVRVGRETAFAFSEFVRNTGLVGGGAVAGAGGGGGFCRVLLDRFGNVFGFDGVIGVIGAVRFGFEEPRRWLPAELMRDEVSKDFSFSSVDFLVFR
jgi:hypothetical protein